MATIQQAEYFKNNSDCLEIAQIMISTVYPKIVLLLKKLGICEVQLNEVRGLKKISITIDSEIHFYSWKNGEKADVYKMKFIDKELCPFFDTELTVKDQESKAEKYIKFCEAVVDAIEPLENRLLEVQKFLDKIRKINIPLSRIVIIEKTNG